MRGWISIVAVSAVLAAGLVAGRAAADSIGASPPATATWSEPPVRSAVAAPATVDLKPAAKTVAPTGSACTVNAWAALPASCNAQGRPVRVIALTQR